MNTLLCPCDICLCRASKEDVEFAGGRIKPKVKGKKNLIHCNTLDLILVTIDCAAKSPSLPYTLCSHPGVFTQWSFLHRLKIKESQYEVGSPQQTRDELTLATGAVFLGSPLERYIGVY